LNKILGLTALGKVIPVMPAQAGIHVFFPGCKTGFVFELVVDAGPRRHDGVVDAPPPDGTGQ